MSVRSYTLLPLTIYGHPSGNYDGSSNNFYSDPVKAVNYYRGQGAVETVWFNLENFQGQITIEANLDQDPGDSTIDTPYQRLNWFAVGSFGDLSSTVTDYYPLVLTGNYTWLRARVQGFDNGTIRAITLVY
jgi:hypothetical protein